MPHKFAEIAFTPTVREIQEQQGSRQGYANMDQGEDYNNALSEREASFIAARDSFYMASVSETGWPYVQHRGGPKGFMKILDANTIGFADYSGNRQYVSTGNFKKDNRVSLFFMDYPNRTRLKLLGRVETVDVNDLETLAKLEDDHYRARIERAFIIHVEAFDWNCPQHITPRYTEQEVEQMIATVLEETSKTKASASITNTNSVHGEGDFELVITGVRQIATNVRAYEFRDPERKRLPKVTAGSHIKMPVILDGKLQWRHYSIATNPARQDAYEIAVLKEEDGSGGSAYIHEHYQLGHTIMTTQPENHFELHADNRPAVLIAGGIGITPIKAMAHDLKARGINMHFHYAGRSRWDMPYRDRLQREFGSQISIYIKDEDQRMNLNKIMSEASPDSLFYICGPQRLIDAALDTARELGITDDRVRYERFSATELVDAKPVTLELTRSGKTIEVPADKSLLDAMLEQDVQIPFSCKSGNCKTCAVKVIDGEAEHHDSALTAHERVTEQKMCPCVSRAKTSKLVLDI